MADLIEHILVVEDDPSLCEWISDYLIDHGYQVSTANRGDTAVELIKIDQPDMVVLDIMLPALNGFDVCKTVRPFYNKPILMLTACNEELDEVLGLELGADDYLNKPVKPRVMLARIKALLRRKQEQQNTQLRIFGELHIDAASKTVTLAGETIALSVNEFEVLWILASHSPAIVSRETLLTQLRGISYDGFDRSIDIRISRLRKKLNDNPSQPYKIKTVRGKGYLFASDAW